MQIYLYLLFIIALMLLKQLIELLARVAWFIALRKFYPGLSLDDSVDICIKLSSIKKDK